MMCNICCMHVRNVCSKTRQHRKIDDATRQFCNSSEQGQAAAAPVGILTHNKYIVEVAVDGLLQVNAHLCAVTHAVRAPIDV